MKSAKLKAIMDIISQMDDMEMDRLMPKEEMDMEEVKRTSKRPEEVLSDYVLNKYSGMEFWRKAKPPISLFI